MKKALASLEIAALVNELQILKGAKISQIYHYDSQLFFLFHTQKGKQILRIIPGQLLNLTQHKKTSPQPTNFCLQLRKYLNQALLKDIQQEKSERIIIFTLEKKERYFLILELFPPGNLILTNQNHLILACLHQKKFKDRFIKPQVPYQFPPPAPDWKALTPTRLKEILKRSQKKNLAAALATDLGLGGLYAEEICKLSNLDKNQPPSSPQDVSSLTQAIKKTLALIKKPAGYIYPQQITPFPLKDQTPLQKTPTYSQALDTLVPNEKISPYEKKIKALQLTLQKQKEAILKKEKEIALYTQKAELIYQHYQPLKKLLAIVQKLKEKKTWEEIKKELQKEKKIKKIDLKNKKIIIDL